MSENQPQPNQPQQKQIQVVDNIPGAEYANVMQAQISKEEILLMFANIAAGRGRVVSKVIVTPGHLKRIVNVLQQSIKNYEGKYGTVEIAQEPNKNEIGFKGA